MATKKITETGPIGLKGIRNTDLYSNLSSMAQGGDEEASAILSALSSPKSRPFSSGDSTSGYFSPQAYEPGTAYQDLGESQYDNPYIVGGDETDVNEIRYENQPWYDTLANGVGKMLGTAGTTFLSSLVGLPYGLVKSAVTGEGSDLWNNEITEGLANADKWLEENMTNYRSQKQQNAAWYDPENLFSMNFIADDVIKNMGFTLGAAASMAVGSGSLGLLSRAFGFADKIGKTGKVASTVLSALYSATGEGMIEARQGVEERNKLEFQKLNDTLAPEYNALNEEEALANQEYTLTGDYNTYSRRIQDITRKRQLLDARKEAGQQQIEESGLEMGNKILLANQALLTAGNLIQFSKGMTKSFDKARHAAEMSEKYAKPFGVGITRVGKNIAEGYKLTGKNLGRVTAATKGLVTEGSEEMNQQWIQSGAGAYYNEKDVNDYWKAKLDPEAYRETTKGLYTLGNAISQGFNESWDDLDQWEQFAIGALTGMTGSYMPSKIFNQDKTKSRWNPARYGSWEGGAVNELLDFKREYSRAKENVDDLNTILAQEDFPARIRSMVGHTYMETQKEEFVDKNDMKAWKDADDKQNIMDIQAFLRAGKLDDLRAIYDEMGKNLSDDDIESIVKSTTQERTDAETGQKYYIGAFVDDKGNRTATNDEIREEIQHNADELNRKLDSYLDSIDTVNHMTNGQLTKDQEDNLAYLHNISNEKAVRVDKIMKNVREQLPSKFLLKTEKTSEQLQKQFASSDLAFSKDDNTKKGYVEVDTSLMNDAAFAAFFINNIIEGQNIQTQNEETKQENREEQLRTNEGLIKKAFVDNAMQSSGKSLKEALNSQEYEQLIDDINDAVQLYSESSEFYNTYLEYMLNPSKADKAKEKAEKDIEDKEKQKAADNASIDDLLDMSSEELANLIHDGDKGKNKAGNKATKALGIKEGKSVVETELNKKVASGLLDPEAAADAVSLLNSQIGKMKQEEDENAYDSVNAVIGKMIDTDTEAMTDPMSLLSEEAKKAVSSGLTELDDNELEKRLSKARDAINSITDPVAKKIQELEESIANKTIHETLDDAQAINDREEVQKKAVDEETKKNTSQNDVRPKTDNANEPLVPVNTILPSKKEREEEKTVTHEGEDDALAEDKKAGQSGKNIPSSDKENNWHPWRSATSYVGYYTNEEWKADPSDPNAEVKQKRYDAVRKKLIKSGAYVARQRGQISPEMKVGFKVFQDVNKEAEDFVIFITDERGNIIGDLPSNNARIESMATDVSLDPLYEEIHKEWEDADDTDKAEGMPSRFYSQVDHVLVGKVLYQNEKQTVAELFNGTSEKPLFAIKTKTSAANNRLETKGVVKSKDILMPLSGKVGQPYILIETPGKHKSQGGFKYYAVPVSTKTIGDIPADSIFKRALRQLLVRIKNKDKIGGIANDVQAKKLLQALVAVNNVHINLDEKSDSKKGLGIRVTKDGNSYDIHIGTREEMNIDSIMDNLAPFFANFSLDYINGNDSKGIKALLTVNGESIGNYNAMMAEIARTNAANTVTVNDWFTIRPLEIQNGALKMVEQADELPEWTSAVSGRERVYPRLQGATREWIVDIDDDYRVYDEKGIEIIPTRENGSKHSDAEKAEACKLAAEVFGKYNGMNSDEKYAVPLWGVIKIYNPKTRKFTTNTDAPMILKGAEKEGRKLTAKEEFDIITEYFENAAVADWGEEDTEKTDHSKEMTKVLSEMKEESSHYHLVKWDEQKKDYVRDPEGDYYQDDRNGNIHARVSNVTDADIEVIEKNEKAGFNGKTNLQLKTASTGAGNALDTFTRSFFKDAVKMLEPLNLSSKEDLATARELAVEINKRIGVPNISEESAVNLMISLTRFKQQLGSEWEINSDGLVASGIVSFDDNTAVKVAGTLDLFAFNQKTGEYMIIDMKSSLAPLFNKDGSLKTDAKTIAKIEHWRAQQTLYKDFIEKKYGIKIKEIRILPFNVSYSTKFEETDYKKENGVLKDKGITVDISPKYAGNTITLTPKTGVKYRTAQLPDSVKRLLPNNPVVKKEEEKLPIKEELKEIAESVPKGFRLKQFINVIGLNPDQATSLMKLADNVEDNKSSNTPVMLTAASQSFLLERIDKEALDKATQETKAAEQKLKIDVPTKNKKDAISALREFNVFGADDLEQLKELSEEALNILLKNNTIATTVKEMLDEEEDIEDIEKEILKADTRHRKATEGSYRMLNLNKELKWLSEVLPQVPKERRLQIVKGLIACSDGTMDFGKVENGIISIGTNAAEGTVYHEAFHYVVQFLMTDTEINNLFEAAREKYGNMPLVALEERLADDFAYYVNGLDVEGSRIKKFFRDLWNAIKSIFQNKSYIDILYRDINNGVYAGREFKDDRNNVFKNINKRQRQVSRNYEYLQQEERERINNAKVSKEEFNALSKEQQEYMLHCVV